MINKITTKQEIESTKENFDKLSTEAKIEAIKHDVDAISYELTDPICSDIFDEEDKKEYHKIILAFNESKTEIDTLLDCIVRLVNICKKKDIPTYKVVATATACNVLKRINASIDDIINFCLFGNPIKPAKNETVKIDSGEILNQESSQTNMIMRAGANAIIDNCRNHSIQNQPLQQQVQQPTQKPVAVMPAHPELTQDQKVDLLKKHIRFVPGRHTNVSNESFDYLIKLVENPYLKELLKKYNSACNPDFPQLIEIEDFDFDRSAFDYAFYADCQDPSKAIIVLFNSVATYVPEVNCLTNNLAVYLEDIGKVIKPIVETATEGNNK